MPFDLVIRNATLLDGSGAPAQPGDIGIDDDRIRVVGQVEGRGHREIDAEGQVVSPGFIDGHTHMDAQLFWDPLGSCSSWHGVTTAVIGNCGFTLAPAASARRHLVVRNLERAEDISPAALELGIDWTWETFPEFLDAVERLPKAINYAANVGHSALRTWVMGERAFEQPAGDDDIAAMRAQLRAALDAGAIGLSTSRSDNHRTSDDRPVASRLADWTEVRQLVDVMSTSTRGIFELALEPAIWSDDASVRDEFAGRLLELAVTSGVPVTFGVPSGKAGTPAVLDLIDATNASGGTMFGQSHSRGISVVLSFSTTLPFDRIPAWAEVRALPLERQSQLLRKAEVRRALVEAARTGPYGEGVGAEAGRPRYEDLLVYDRPLPPYRTVQEVADDRGVDPVEAMIDLAIESRMDAMFVEPLTSQRDNDILAVMMHPSNVMTFSDSGAHVSQIVDCSIHTHLLAYWVRQRKAVELEHAVRMITSEPARAWGFHDRGRLAPGYVADINVFDPDTVGPLMPTVGHDLPGGGTRLVMKAAGIRATIIGGEVVFEDGEHTGALPGRLVRDGGQHCRQ